MASGVRRIEFSWGTGGGSGIRTQTTGLDNPRRPPRAAILGRGDLDRDLNDIRVRSFILTGAPFNQRLMQTPASARGPNCVGQASAMPAAACLLLRHQLKKPCRSNSAPAAMTAINTSSLNVSGAI